MKSDNLNVKNPANPLTPNFEKISEKIDAFSHDTVNYIFFTDTHADAYLLKDEDKQLTLFESEDAVNLRIEQMVSHIEAAVDMANNDDDIDFIAVGGDVINAYCIEGKEAVINTLHRSLAPLKDSKKPVIIAFGNHDDNAFQILNPNVPEVDKSWIISDKDWKEKVLDYYPLAEGRVHDNNYEYSKYFYYDMPEKKTRIIVLDTMDSRRPFDENGVVNGDPQLKRICYTHEQLDWLVNQALTKGEEWKYIFISHMGIDNATNSNKMWNGEILREIIKAYQSNQSYSFTYTDLNGKEITVNADYTDKSTGKILMFSFGHQHAELVLYSEDVNLWQVSSGCENIRGGWGCAGSDTSLPWKVLSGRQYGTETETCIDVISVNEKVCYKFNVGPGDDAEMIYPSL